MKNAALAFAILLVGLSACGKSASDTINQKLKTFEGTVEGVAFSIKLPEGMRQKDTPDQVDFDVLIDDRVYEPRIMVRYIKSTLTLEKALSMDKKDRKLYRKETVTGGYIISGVNPYRDDGGVTVSVGKNAGGGMLTCHLTASKAGGVPDTEKVVPKLEQLCLSLTAK